MSPEGVGGPLDKKWAGCPWGVVGVGVCRYPWGPWGLGGTGMGTPRFHHFSAGLSINGCCKGGGRWDKGKPMGRRLRDLPSISASMESSNPLALGVAQDPKDPRLGSSSPLAVVAMDKRRGFKGRATSIVSGLASFSGS